MATPPAKPEPPLYRPLMALAGVAALFSLILSALLLHAHLTSASPEFLNSPPLTEARLKLRANPTDAKLKEDVRRLDLQLRQQYFRDIERMDRGGLMALIGFGVFLFALERAQSVRKIILRSAPRIGGPEETLRAMNRARITTGTLAAVLAGTLLSAAWTLKPRVFDGTADLAKVEKLLAGEIQKPAGPTLAELRANWPRFRGADGTGIAHTTNAPTAWNAATGEGIRWKTEVKALGFNSPVVWGDRLFFSGGDEKSRDVLCYDANTGALLWQKPVQLPPGALPKVPEIPESTGFAASGVATDGQRVYAIFATGELVALDYAGRQVWAKAMGVPKNMYGHATSLVTWQGKLIVQYDQGEPEEEKSRLYALDAATGRIVWETPRKVPSSWSTPLIIEAAQKTQIITFGEPWVISYNAMNGQEIWRVDCLGADLAPSPTFAGGLVCAPSPYKALTAIRPDGSGDVTKTHVAWFIEDLVPDVTSPAGTEELLFTATGDGMLGCFDLKTGKKVWEQELKEPCHASPSIVGGHVYLFTTKGKGLIVQAGREFKELARNELGEPINASPAFVGNRIYVRGDKHLFCIGPKE